MIGLVCLNRPSNPPCSWCICHGLECILVGLGRCRVCTDRKQHCPGLLVMPIGACGPFQHIWLVSLHALTVVLIVEPPPKKVSKVAMVLKKVMKATPLPKCKQKDVPLMLGHRTCQALLINCRTHLYLAINDFALISQLCMEGQWVLAQSQSGLSR